MKTIHRYMLELNPETIQTLELPVGAIIRTVQLKYDNICLWAEIDTNNIKDARRFIIHGTGQQLYDHVNYLGTVQTHEGQFVWHIYEIVKQLTTHEKKNNTDNNVSHIRSN